MAHDDHTTDDERALFRATVGPVRRVTTQRLAVKAPPPVPEPRQTRDDEARVRDEMLDGGPDPDELETGDELLYARPGLQHRVLRRLRRGQVAVGAQLDLHGMTAVAARAALAGFLSRCGDEGVTCVRIVHGKGNSSLGRVPVIKSRIGGWLRRRHDVLAYCSTPPHDGGTGAVYVLLKRR